MTATKRPPAATIYMKPEQRQFLAQEAAARGLSSAALVRVALAHYCGDFPNGDQANG